MVKLQTTPSVFALSLLMAALAACGGAPETPSHEVGSSPESSSRRTIAEEKSKAAHAATQAETLEHERYGAALADPTLYYGVYASAERPDQKWFINEAKRPTFAEQAAEVPPGHLALGAFFGDVASYHLKTLSETVFTQAWLSDQQLEPVSIEFELGGDGHAVAFSFTDKKNAPLGRLERQGDIPEGWE